MFRRLRPLATTLLAAGCLCAVTACGSSSHSSTGASAAGAATARPAGLKLTTSEQACLKKHGVTLGAGAGGFGARGGTPPAGAGRGSFPKGAKRGSPPRGGKGGFPAGSGRGGAGFAPSAAREKAFKACGVSFGGGGAGAPPAG